MSSITAKNRVIKIATLLTGKEKNHGENQLAVLRSHHNKPAKMEGILQLGRRLPSSLQRALHVGDGLLAKPI